MCSFFMEVKGEKNKLKMSSYFETVLYYYFKSIPINNINMQILKITLLVFVVGSINLKSFTQNSINNFQSLYQISKLGDTLEVDVNQADIQLLWLNDTLEVVRYFGKPYKYDLEKVRKIKNDPSYLPSKERIEKSYKMFAFNSQNCHSYSLEKYFKNIGVKTDNIFDYKSFLEGKSFEKIINNTFKKINEFPATKRKYFKQNIPNGTLIVFINNRKLSEHSFFFNNGIFYTKNGMFKPLKYKKMKDILNIYIYTELIQFYKLDSKIIVDFINNN